MIEQGATLDKATDWGSTPLITAAYNGHLEVCRYLLEQGADRDKAQNDGMTSLHYATLNGHLEIAMLLMLYGADLNARTDDGDLPIDLARTEEIKQVIRDEPRRRMDEAPGKRATDQDRHPDTAIPASAQQDEEAGKEEEFEQINKKPRKDVRVAAADGDKTKVVAEEDEDSEPSSDEDDD